MKLKDGQIKALFKAFEKGRPAAAVLAAKYGVANSTINYWKRRWAATTAPYRSAVVDTTVNEE